MGAHASTIGSEKVVRLDKWANHVERLMQPEGRHTTALGLPLVRDRSWPRDSKQVSVYPHIRGIVVSII